MSTVSCSSMDDVVNFAIEKEEKAMEFYQSCAERARNPGIKKFFQEMVEEERRHRDLLKNLDPVSLGSLTLDRIEDLRISDYLVDVTFTDEITYQEALTLAMKKEEKAHAFYSAWQGKCMHEKTAKVFEMLAQEEMKHKRRIETMYDEEILTWD
ncbi:MAG: ferritin family protein [Deltaproteobacteria bacterium]|nr:ferritin family protein [Deltaproteobacteria bacterium]